METRLFIQKGETVILMVVLFSRKSSFDFLLAFLDFFSLKKKLISTLAFKLKPEIIGFEIIGWTMRDTLRFEIMGWIMRDTLRWVKQYPNNWRILN